MTTGLATPGLAIAAYAETWITGAKVVVFGNALSPLAERLIERGARLVYVYDASAARVSEATARGGSSLVSYAPLSQAGSAMRDGVFDVGIIEDLTQSQEPPPDLVARLHRALSHRGTAIVATRNPQARRFLVPSEEAPRQDVSYYDLYDAVSAEFEDVRMCGQTPFVGYAVADFGATEDPEVQVDTAFLSDGAEEPEWFFALASPQPEAPGAFCVIQLPFAEVGVTPAPETRSSPDTEQVAELQKELEQREEWLADVEGRAAAADERSDAMQSELDRVTEEGETRKRALARVRKELGEAEALTAQARQDTTSEEQRRRQQDEHQRNTAQLQNNAAQLELKASQLRSNVTELEGTVRELESTVTELEAGNLRANKKLLRFEATVQTAEIRATQAEAALGAAEKLAARAQAGIDGADKRADKRAAETQATIDAAKERAEKAEQALTTAEERVRVAQSAVGAAEGTARRTQEQSTDLQRLLDDERGLRKSAESQAGERGERAQSADLAHQQLLSEKDNLVADLARLKTQLERGLEGERQQRTEARKLETAAKRLKASETKVAELQSRLKSDQNNHSDTEWQAAEGRLRERGQAVLQLQKEQESTERLCRELLVELEELRANPTADDNTEADSQLRTNNARLTADLEAARWTIEALEGRLSGASSAE